MDADKQAEGEARVMALVFKPLEDLGLGRPTTTTFEGYQTMKRTVCQCLAGRSPEVLEELRGWAQKNPSGPKGDRVPNGAALLNKADQIAPPERNLSASPLMREVFSHETGIKALEEGWAPELLLWFKKRPLGERHWPKRFTLSQIKTDAYQAVRRFQDIKMRLERGDDIGPEDRKFHSRRLEKIRECEGIRAEGLAGQAA